MTISQWDQVPEFAGEAEEASFGRMQNWMSD